MEWEANIYKVASPLLVWSCVAARHTVIIAGLLNS